MYRIGHPYDYLHI